MPAPTASHPRFTLPGRSAWLWASVTMALHFAADYLAMAHIPAAWALITLWWILGLVVGLFVAAPRGVGAWPLMALAIVASGALANSLIGVHPDHSRWGYLLAALAAPTAGIISARAADLLAGGGGRPDLRRLRDVAAVVLSCGLLAPFISSGIVRLAGTLTYGAPTSPFLSMWMTDAVGCLILAPTILAWVDGAGRLRSTSPRRAAALGLYLVAFGLLVVAAFNASVAGWAVPTVPLLLLLPLLLSAAWHGPVGAVTAGLMLALLTEWFTATHRGPFALLAASVGDRIVACQVYVAVCSVVSLVVAATIAEWLTARRRLAESEALYKVLVEAGGDLVSFRAIAGSTVYVSPSCEAFFDLPAAELKTTDWRTRVHPDDLEHIEEMRRINLAGNPIRTQYRLITRHGGVFWMDLRTELVRDAAGRPVYMLSVSRDITARVEQERRLRESEHRYHALFDQSPTPFMVFMRDDLRMVDANLAAEKLYGYSRDELLALTAADLRPPEDVPAFLARMRGETVEPPPGGWRHRRKDGSTFLVEVAGQHVEIANRPARLVLVTDATEMRIAQHALTEQNRILELIARDTPLASILEEVVRAVQAQNPALRGSVLLLDDDRQTFRTAAAPDLPEPYCRAIDGLRIGPTVGSCGTAMWRRERVITESIALDPLWNDYRELAGRHGLAACWSEPIVSSKGNVLGSLALYSAVPAVPCERMIRSLTAAAHLAGIAVERRRLEAALSETEARFRALFQQASVGIARISPSGRFLMANQRACEILGRTMEDLSGRSFAEITHSDDVDRNIDLLRSNLTSGDGYSLEKRYLRPDGSTIWADVAVRIVRDAAGQPEYLIAAIQDISERIEASRRLVESEQRFRMLTEVSQDFVAHFDLSGRRLYRSPAILRVFEFDDEELARTDTTLRVHPDDLAATAAAREAVLRGESSRIVFRCARRDGQYLWIDMRIEPVKGPGGEVLSYITYGRDITERNAAQAALAASEKRYRSLLTDVRVIVWEADAVTWRFTFVAGRAEEILGYTPEQWLAEGFWLKTLHPEDRDRAAGFCLQQTNLGLDHEFEYRALHRDGSTVWLRDLVSVEMRDGKPLAIRGVIIDVTEQRAAEHALRESQATNLALLSALPDSLFRVDARGAYISFHAPQGATLLVPPEKFLGRTMREVLPTEIAEPGMRALTAALATGISQVYEYQTQRSERRHWWECRVVRTAPAEALIVVRDVTQRHEAEEALRDSQRRFSLLINQSPIGVIVWNTRFEITQWNPSAQRIFGFTPAEVVGKHGSLIVPAEARPAVDDAWRALMAQRGGSHVINENLTRSGERIICEWNNTPLVGADGAVIGVSSFVQDVTERIMSERRQALMMQELDHRVKNNMAAVLSLAEQTGRSTANFDQFQATFMGRVRALARMHTALASSRWRGADLRSLIRQTVEPYRGLDEDRLVLDGPPVTLPPRAAQSLAMTLNELATNAAKYGSLSVPAGRVAVSWTFKTQDNLSPPILGLHWTERHGPITTPPQRRGLGIELIEGAIIYQLGGQVTFRFAPDGLECVLTAPLTHDEVATPVSAANGVR